MLQPNAYFRLMRMHQPVGIWLVYWPCAWAILLAASQTPHLPPHTLLLYIPLFFLGALITRSGGCIINDMADRELDKHVERTKARPLASGELRPIQALWLLAGMAVLALVVLATLLSSLPAHVRPLDLLLITLPVVALIVAYPFMKRITWWPQAFLGITFNWGVFIGWVAIAGTISPTAIALYVSCIFWTLGYDTIYGHQDKRDDEKIGIKSTSRYLEKGRKWWIAGFYTAMMLCLLAACLLAGMGITYALLALLVVAGHCGWQLARWNPDKPANCLAIFKSNAALGALLALWLLVVTQI